MECIVSRSDALPVCLEMDELTILEDAVIFLKRYIVLKNKVERP